MRASAHPRRRASDLEPSAYSLQPSLLFPHDSDFRLQLDPMPFFDRAHHVRNELFDVGGTRGAVVHDEVRMHLRDARTADAKALEPARIDQSRRVIAWRVREDRAARPLADRLRRLTAREQNADVIVADTRARFEAQSRTEKPFIRRALHMPIANRVVGRGPYTTDTRTIERLDRDHVAPGFAAECARIHRECAAERARNAREELRWT